MTATLAASQGPDQLSLTVLERFADNSGFLMDVVVQAGLFTAAHYALYAEPVAVNRFVDSLDALYESLNGEARLAPRYEPQFVMIQALRGGRMLVSGRLIEHGEHEQELRFHFASDQTCLGAFLQALRAELEAHA